MSEFESNSAEFVEMTSSELPDTTAWDKFDTEQIDGIDVKPMPEPSSFDFDGISLPSEAEKAADYARSYGFDKAADYIERHYDGDEFVPGNPIPITTRNMALDGTMSDNGVLFKRRTAELADGLPIEGVFPDFESRHHVELGRAANDMSIHQQFSACKEDFQEHMYDDPEKIRGISFGAMEKMDLPQGYTPEGYTWQHNPETGSFDLVSKDDHSVGHTGGNALWGD